jgi:hypothetical protein
MGQTTDQTFSKGEKLRGHERQSVAVCCKYIVTVKLPKRKVTGMTHCINRTQTGVDITFTGHILQLGNLLI